MDLPPGDIFDTETEDIPENVQADLDRMSYTPRLSEVTTEAGDLVNSGEHEELEDEKALLATHLITGGRPSWTAGARSPLVGLKPSRRASS